jgi:hypothetical protein
MRRQARLLGENLSAEDGPGNAVRAILKTTSREIE